MECTRPALACHCAKFSTSIRYLPVKSPCPKCTVTAWRRCRRSQARQHHAQIARIAQIQFADAVGGSGLHQIHILHEFLVGLHALFAFFARHVFRKSGHDREMKILALRAVQQHAMSVNQRQFGAIAEKRDGRTFRDVDAQTIRQDALHAGFFHPGQFLQSACAAHPAESAARCGSGRAQTASEHLRARTMWLPLTSI